MHYGDTKQLEKNILQVVIYTHSQSDTTTNHFQITSIRKCEYFSPRLLAKLIKDLDKNQVWFGKTFPEMLKLQQEKWWLVTFREVEIHGEDDTQLTITEIVDVSNDSDDSYRLH